MMSLDAVSAEKTREDLRSRYPSFSPAEFSEIAIIGAADEGQRLCALAASAGIHVVAVVDDNPCMHGRVLDTGHTVSSALPSQLDPQTPIVIASHRVLNATSRLKKQGFPNVLGFGVLQTMYPDTFAPHMFYEDWLEDLEQNAERYAKVFELLADDTSRSIFTAIMGYRTTGKIELLGPWVDPVMFYPDDLFLLGSSEVYIDAGAYTGDTIELFIERTGGEFDRIIGFEPDAANYAEFEQRFADDPRIEAKPMGLYRDRRVLRFSANSGRASGLSDVGEIEVPVTSIDLEMQGRSVSYIKLNIEGAELDALSGASETINRWKPRLCVSGYHRASHLWEVPLLIKELCPSYDIFLRQHDGGTIESTYYGLTPDHVRQ